MYLKDLNQTYKAINITTPIITIQILFILTKSKINLDTYYNLYLSYRVFETTKGQNNMYGNRTAAGIKKLKESSYSKIGDPIFLAKRRRKHREDPRVRDRGSDRDRANSKKWLFDIPTYKDLKPVPKYCEIFKNRIMEVGDGKSTDNSPTLDRIGNEEYYVSRRIDTEDGTEYVGNTQWVCRKANQMKSDATFKEIKMLYLWAVKEHKNGNLK